MADNYYNPIWDTLGNKLHTHREALLYWNDALWNRSVPKSTSGLTYLDVGFCNGGYLLRWQQRGGQATGLEPMDETWISPEAEKNTQVGDENRMVLANRVRTMWFPIGGCYQMLYGGFSSSGSIVPELGKFTISSSFNVIEYLNNQQSCVESLFEHATDRVLIATDTANETVRLNYGNVRIQRTSAEDLVKWCKWPCIVWKRTFPVHGEQVFICSTNPDSSLKIPDASEPQFDSVLDKTDTQKEWEKSHHV